MDSGQRVDRTHVGELVEPGEEVVEDAHQLLGLARRRER